MRPSWRKSSIRLSVIVLKPHGCGGAKEVVALQDTWFNCHARQRRGTTVHQTSRVLPPRAALRDRLNWLDL